MPKFCVVYFLAPTAETGDSRVEEYAEAPDLESMLEKVARSLHDIHIVVHGEHAHTIIPTKQVVKAQVFENASEKRSGARPYVGLRDRGER